MLQNECKYEMLLHSSDCALGETLSLVLGEDDCPIINNLFSEKLCNMAGHFYSSFFIFIFSRPLKQFCCCHGGGGGGEGGDLAKKSLHNARMHGC